MQVAVARRRATRQQLLYLVLMGAVTGEQARMLVVAQGPLVELPVAEVLEELVLTVLLGAQAAREQTAQSEFIVGR